MTRMKINATMPHTWIVWDMYAECVQPHSYTRNECCSFILSFWKLPHSLRRTAKTLSVCKYNLHDCLTKLGNFSQTNNTQCQNSEISAYNNSMSIVYLCAKFAEIFDKINIDFQLCYPQFGIKYSIISNAPRTIFEFYKRRLIIIILVGNNNMIS